MIGPQMCDASAEATAQKMSTQETRISLRALLNPTNLVLEDTVSGRLPQTTRLG